MASEDVSRSGHGWIFAVALIACLLIAWMLPAGSNTPTPEIPLRDIPPVTVEYLFVDEGNAPEPVRLTVRPDAEADAAALAERLASCFVFPRKIVPITPEDSALLATIKPYTDKDNVITDRELKAGAVQQVRVLLENSFQRLREAKQFKLILVNPPTRVALGQEFAVEIGVEGVDPRSVVEIKSTIGEVKPVEGGEKWILRGKIDQPGDAILAVWGRDRRGLGVKSNAPRIEHALHALPPAPLAAAPIGAFINEPFTLNLAVQGYENTSAYSWQLSLDGAPVKEGKGTIVQYDVPEDALGKKLVVNALYKNATYQRALDSTAKSMQSSDYEYVVTEPIDRIVQESFGQGRDYNLSQIFQFYAVRCGRCVSSNLRAIDAREISVSAEADGRDILEEYRTETIMNNAGLPAQTKVTFWLNRRMKVNKNGTDVTITVRAGKAPAKTVTVVIYPDGN
jgi:hypothetical protein